MRPDAIIDEVREIRNTIASAHNYDLAAIFQMLREREARSARPHVTLPPKRWHEGWQSGGAEAAQQAAAVDRPSAGC